MPMDKFLIAPLNTGLQTNLKNWLIMDDAFEMLQNAYIFRGRVSKRFGSYFTGTAGQLSSRLRINLGTTAGTTGNFSGTVPGTIFGIGQMFAIGSTILTVYQTGTPAATHTTGLATATYNTTTGALVVTGNGENPTTPIYFYPALPVTGITQYDTGIINNHPTYAFDPEFAYTFSTGTNGWDRSGTAVWHGNPNGTNLMWTYNWRGTSTSSNAGESVLFATNYNAAIGASTPTVTDDPIWYLYDNAGTLTWVPLVGDSAFFFNPSGKPLYGGPFIQTAKIIVGYKGYLLLLNTIENDNSTPQNPGATDGSGNASSSVAGNKGAIGSYFIIGTTTFTVTGATGALTVSPNGTGTGTYNVSTGAYTFAGAALTTQIYFYSGVAAGNATRFSNRCRYSFYGSPFERNSWYEFDTFDTSGSTTPTPNNVGAGGGFVDAATEEQIVSVGFIKDRLIVYFERSTWELAFSGNYIQPFNFNRLNAELGSQSTFSSVQFDKELLTIGNTGIHGCNGSNVARIDEKIPDEVFEFLDDAVGHQRTYGIRDFYGECVYWAFMTDDVSTTQTFPNQILLYNYQNRSWALLDDCITAFGYFEQQMATTWANSAPTTWEQATQTWAAGTSQSNQRLVLAGSQEGFMVRIASGDDDRARNAPSMQLTNITYNGDGTLNLTIINHNLVQSGGPAFGYPDYILLENISADATTISVLNNNIFEVVSVIDANTITINTAPLDLDSGTYHGGGTVARVSNIQVLTKAFNPYDKDDSNVYVAKVDFLVTKTGQVNRDSNGNVLSVDGGEITVDYYPSSTELSMIQAGTKTGAIMGNSVLETKPYSPIYYPIEEFQERLWHNVFFQSVGNCIQLKLYFSPFQMLTSSISLADFELHGLVLYTQRTGRMQ